MYDKVHEQIQVLADFEPGQKPNIRSFVWNNKLHSIEQLTLITRARKGRELVWMFHVTTKTMAFKLRLETESLSWWLEEISWDAEQN